MNEELKKEMEAIHKKGDQLSDVRKMIDEIENEAKEKVAPLKAIKEEIQQELLMSLKGLGLKSIKSSSGDSITVSKKKGYNIDEFKITNWAIENRCITVNKLMVAQRLKNATPDQIPVGVEVVESEFISIRKPSAKAETAEGEAEAE